jgi:hypothetical protein
MYVGAGHVEPEWAPEACPSITSCQRSLTSPMYVADIRNCRGYEAVCRGFWGRRHSSSQIEVYIPQPAPPVVSVP